MSRIQLLPRDQLDEFGLVMDFVDYVSDTFPNQTDICEIGPQNVRWIQYNVTPVVLGILDRKFSKIVRDDPRLTFRAQKFVGDDVYSMTLQFPHPSYHTVHTGPVYANLAVERFVRTEASYSAPRKMTDFTDINHASRILRIALYPVITYQENPVDLSHDRLHKGKRTGDKSCVKPKKKPSYKLRW